MRSRLPDHPRIYVPIILRCNCEITYTKHMRLHTTMPVLGRHHNYFCTYETTDRNNSFQNSWPHRPFPNCILIQQRIIPQVGQNLNTRCLLLQLLWSLTCHNQMSFGMHLVKNAHTKHNKVFKIISYIVLFKF